MKSREYFAAVQDSILAAPQVIQSNLSFDEVSETECYLRGTLTLTGGYVLHIAEYTVTEPEIKRLKYRYHFQTGQDQFIARWDNAPHHPEIATHPDHLHTAAGVKPCVAMDVARALSAALEFME